MLMQCKIVGRVNIAAMLLFCIFYYVATCVSASSDLCNITTETTEGFDYIRGAPVKNFSLCTPSLFPSGTKLAVNGRVIDADCQTPLPSILDIWSADPNGTFSDNNTFECRSRVYTDPQGYYDFVTVMPGWYKERLHRYRPAHIFWKITPTNNASYRTLTTQMYFKHDPFLGDNDPCPTSVCHSDDPTLIVPITKQNGDNYWTRFDIVMQRSCFG